MEEMDLTGMTWYGALMAVIMTMILMVTGRKARRFDATRYTRSEITRMAEETVHSERDRRIILRRLLDGIRMEQLAEEFDMSVPQIKRIVYRAEDCLASCR